MGVGYWRGVVRDGVHVPPDRTLGDLTAELTTMLGSPDPEIRDGLALQVLTVWIGRGVYDDLLVGLGDGMVAGLRVGIGETGTPTVFRRSWSARVIAHVLRRDNDEQLLPREDVLRWGDLLTSWLLREQDVRGWIPEQGTARAVAHGADAIGALAGSRHLDAMELTVLLDVVADRLVRPSPLDHGETDHLAAATVQVLARERVPFDVVERWVARVGAAADPESVPASSDPWLRTRNAQELLRSLHLQLLLGPHRPSTRADLLLAINDALRSSNGQHLPRMVTGK
ncbi:DUF2785 domain-containing protein [Nocardioides daphniae]|uniref:DUF2785 domain-containing protein n=1 Tax=Nocardioides daphniae TaxID=402297 RepID=A0A4P7UC85_9ACTN|nr:DUF2785 domain-containing protein [Nocardioides daphniae]QCC77750.1 DUF2785 domain-containing protein [Nocardioides daphniae]GGD28800.1 hypothetical protein GCM10007231_30380 [Nocardioides daphniae]